MLDVHVIKNTNFRKVTIQLWFPFEYDVKDNLIRGILGSLMVNGDKANPTSLEFNKALLKNYIYSLGYRSTTCNNQGFFVFTATIPEKKYLGEDALENACEALYNYVYHPNVKDDKFDEKIFENKKDAIIAGLQNSYKNINQYSRIRICEEMDNGIFGYDEYRHPEVLDNLTSKNVYNFYQKYVGTKKPYVFVFGDLEEAEVKTLFNKYFDSDKECVPNIKRKDYFLGVPKKVKTIEEKGPFNQSIVKLGYVLKDMKDEEELLFRSLIILLTSANTNLLTKKLRNENDLAYQTYVTKYSLFGAFTISALINKKDKDKAIELMKEVIEDLKNPEKMKDAVERVLLLATNDLICHFDKRMAILNDYIDNYFDIAEPYEKEYEKIQKLTVDEICEFAKRLELSVVYYLEGDRSE